MLELEGKVRIPSGCAIAGIINKKGKTFAGKDISKMIISMRERSNGLGGGFAAYGIYSGYSDFYAIHMFYNDNSCKENTEQFLRVNFNIEVEEKIPVRKVPSIKNAPIIWRYFVKPRESKLVDTGLSEDEFMVDFVMKVNSSSTGAFVVSSGKNMGVFKAVGYPEDVGEYYRIDEYNAYIWTVHGRFPTNTPGWWGGAHPFALLDWSVVHNGEISSYGINYRYLEMFGYKCTLQTDTEAITYLFDLLIRKHNLPLEAAVSALAAPFWDEIDRMDKERKELVKSIRTTYSSALVNGPFSIIVGTRNGIIALNDRIKLRPMVAAEKCDFLYIASEESAIKQVCSKPEKVWTPRGGEAVIALLEGVDRIWA